MRLGEYASIAWESLRVNKLRASLTLLGISIGIAAVIVLAAVGSGARRQILAEFNEQAGNQVIVMPQFDQSGKPPIFPKAEDVEALRRALPNAPVAPLAYLRLPLTWQGKQYYPNISGTTGEFFALQRLRIRQGRLLTKADEQSRARVCAIGSGTANRLFGVRRPVGDWLRLGGERFRVVGVLAAKSEEESLLGLDQRDRLEVYIPAATALALNNTDDYLMVMVGPPSAESTPAVIAAIKTVLARLHGPKARFNVISTEQMLKSLGVITSVLTALLIAVGGIALVVGGIGIMNIMLVSVTERTREIGIRKSIGAKRRDIMRQFLIEAVILCLGGAAVGMAVGIVGEIGRASCRARV